MSGQGSRGSAGEYQADVKRLQGGLGVGVEGLPAGSQPPPRAPLCVFQCFLVMVIILIVQITAATVVLAFFPVVSTGRLLPLHIKNRWNQ